MFSNIGELQSFYHTRAGILIRRLVKGRLRALIEPLIGRETCVGLGFCTPYLDIFQNEKNMVLNLMPSSRGHQIWPDQRNQKNKTASVLSTELPLPSNSVDCVFLMHFLEYAEYPEAALQEIWRVLKSTGHLVLVVPNRSSIWARCDWSPFGHGRPFSTLQLRRLLQECLFVWEKDTPTLFFPPVRWRLKPTKGLGAPVLKPSLKPLVSKKDV